ncbi:MAG: glycosyltransferase family 39 protein [Deltaproteobacteria bacterium]|nr:glycosyltransferase family 39 protein [Deltaproteobacteria bacterium]
MVAPTVTPSAEPLAASSAHPALRPAITAAWAWLRVHGPISALLIVGAALRSFRLGEVSGMLIGDECWYVQDARVILGLPVMLKNLPAAPLSGLDPNSEHPPLAKLIMAGSMRLFGNTEIAWRIPSVILGTLSILLLYAIVLRLGGSRKQAWLAAFVLAFENLSFIHGRIAMLDIYVVAFVLLATWLYLTRRFELAGVVFGVAALCKVNGLFGLGAMLLYDLVRARRHLWPIPWRWLWPRARAVIFALGFFLLGLGALDAYWTEYRSPFAHLSHMFSYHASLKHVGRPEGNESTPGDWWLNGGAFNYMTWTQTVNGVSKYTVFRAAMNEYVIFAAPMALFYAAWRAWNRSRLGAFAVASLICMFGPMFAAWVLADRKSYIFYMVPSVPAIACAIALMAPKLPRPAQWGFVVAVLYAYAFNFPFKYL